MQKINLKLTLKRKTPEHVLAVLGFMAAVASPQAMGMTEVDEGEVLEITHVIARGFSVPLATKTADDGITLDRETLIRPSFFNLENWSSLFVGLNVTTNLDALTENNPEDDIVVTVDGSIADASVDAWLSLVRFVREHHVKVETATEILVVESEDPMAGKYVCTLNPDYSITWTKWVGDIEQPLDPRWDTETPYALNNEVLMKHLVGLVRNETTVTTTQLAGDRKASNAKKIFIQQTGVNKVLLAYYRLVSYEQQQVSELLGDLPGNDPVEQTVVFIDPGLVTVLGDLLAMSITRVAHTGILNKVEYLNGKAPYGNRNLLAEIQMDLELLIPGEKSADVRETLRNYLEQVI